MSRNDFKLGKSTKYMLMTSYITKFPTFDLLMGEQVTFKLDFGKTI